MMSTSWTLLSSGDNTKHQSTTLDCPVVAAIRGNLDEIKRLVEQVKVDVNIPDVRVAFSVFRYTNPFLTPFPLRQPTMQKFGRYALLEAAANGFYRIAVYLLDHGADPSKINNNGDGRTLFQLAAWRRWLPMLKRLVDAGRGVDVIKGDVRGWTAIHEAMASGAQTLVLYLVGVMLDLLQSGAIDGPAMMVRLQSHTQKCSTDLFLIQLSCLNRRVAMILVFSFFKPLWTFSSWMRHFSCTGEQNEIA